MPRGHLKHHNDIGNRKARGGSSYRGKASGKNQGRNQPPPRPRSAVGDFALCTAAGNKSSVNKKTSSEYAFGECAICFEEGPVVCLSNKCKWHGAACRKCLRRIHVTDAQKSPKKYPLACFHPLCDRTVHAPQLEKHGIFASSKEVMKHHEMLLLSKIEKEGMITVHCPDCDAPRGIRRLGDKDKTFRCSNPCCNATYQVSPYYATIRALDNMKADNLGHNDGWARCPHCGILISKGEGCDHMWCVNCDNEFYWDEAQRAKGRLPRHARVPDGEIHRWR